MLEFPHILIAAAILLGASLNQGFFGFGFGIIAMGGLTLSHDLVHASGVVNLTCLMLTIWMVVQLRRAVLWRVAGRMLPGVLVGVALGVAALKFLDRGILVRVLGATIVVVAVWNVVSPMIRTRESLFWDNTLGLAGGMLCGAFNTGGPPVIPYIYARREAPEQLKATLNTIFLVMAVSRLPIAASQGLITIDMCRDGAVLLPVVLGGTVGGIFLARLIPPEKFRKTCWVALGLLGVALLIVA
ncbi:MAG: TSUP family transporter [Planctomycetota bacterium]|jgi:uncharacterized membrane protein YfcA